MSLTPGLTPQQLNYAEIAQWKQSLKQAATVLRCASPGFLVDDMDYTHQTVRVQVAIQERVRTPQGSKWYDIPPIVNVPVLTPRGGGFCDTFPLKKGDQGLLIFCDTCFDSWWQNGQTNAPPADNTGAVSGSQRQFEVRRHYIHDCGFFPGMWSQNRLVPNWSSTSRQIRTDDAATLIDVAPTGVTITGAATSIENGGTTQALMTDTFFQWFKTNIEPFLVAKGYAGPAIPTTGCETTVLAAE